MSLLIRNGRIVDPLAKTDEILDILIENGKIVKKSKSQILKYWMHQI